MGIGRVTKGALLVVVGAAGGGAALAVAGVPDSTSVIRACVELDANGAPLAGGANLRVIDPSRTQACRTTSVPGAAPSEATLDWNVTGPPGPAGTNGTNGTNGAPGAPGGSPTLTISSPLISGRRIANITFTGGLELSSDILAYSFATSQGGSASHGGGGRAGRTAIRDIQVTKAFDKSSAKLALACATGTHIKKATISLLKSGKGVIYKLSDVLIAADQAGGSGGKSETPTETLTLNFTKIEIEYHK